MKKSNLGLTIVILVILISLLTFFWPSSYVKGGVCGFIGWGAEAYKEESDCFGIKRTTYPWGCMDCCETHLCYGITYDQKCYLETYNREGWNKEPVGCK
jgi:hypothetical protein